MYDVNFSQRSSFKGCRGSRTVCVQFIKPIDEHTVCVEEHLNVCTMFLQLKSLRLLCLSM